MMLRQTILLMTVLLLIPMSVEASNLYIEVRDGEVHEIVPFTYNPYYQREFYFGMDGESSDEIVSGNTIEIETEYDIEVFILDDIDFSSNYEITVDGQTEDVSFCNNDGQCQPCFEGLCENIENYLTCPEDCPSGGEDNFCDLQRDGVCDPDCDGYDFDCDECIDKVCLYDGMEVDRETCSDIGGTSCRGDEVCEGYETYADDTGMGCCIGQCAEESDEEVVQEESEGEESGEPRETTDVQEEERNPVLFYLISTVAFLSVALITGVFVIGKRIKTEHQVRSYVDNLMQTGYSPVQIEEALKQQKIDRSIVESVMKRYRR